MPVTVASLKKGGILLKGEGAVTGNDIIEANNTIYATLEKIHKINYQLCDYSNVTEFNISREEVKFIADQDKEAAKINPKMFIAVIGEKDLVYGLSRMWEAHVDISPMETNAFRNIKDAEKWIEEKLLLRLHQALPE